MLTERKHICLPLFAFALPLLQHYLQVRLFPLSCDFFNQLSINWNLTIIVVIWSLYLYLTILYMLRSYSSTKRPVLQAGAEPKFCNEGAVKEGSGGGASSTRNFCIFLEEIA